jgi:putative ABC transport system permease protein
MWTALGDQLLTVGHTFRHHKIRSFLTLLGIIMGSGSIVLLSGLLAGGKEALVSTAQFIDEADVITVKRILPPPDQRLRTRRSLDLSDAKALDGNPAIGQASVEASLTEWERWARVGSRKKKVMVLGASERAAPLYRIEVAKGRFLDATDLRHRARVCVVGNEVWRELLQGKESLAGVSLQVAGIRWEVIGVLKRKPPLVAGPGTWMWDRRIVVPSTTFATTLRLGRQVDELYIRLQPSLGPLMERLETTQRLVQSILSRRHHGVENFRLSDEEKESKKKEELIILIINVLMLCTAALSLFVGGINIMNIMLVTVTERTREIGIRCSLGATPGHILRQFLFEAALIATLGGLLGVLGGVALEFIVSKGLALWLGQWTAHYKLWAILTGLLSSTLTGILFGLTPALRAARMKPIEALRYE